MTSDDTTKRLQKIEDSLQRVFPAQTNAEWARRVAGPLEPMHDLTLRPESLDRINAPAWELLRRGGKRWRPLVLVLSHEVCSGTFEDIYDWSALVELPHNGSLIVDDIEDGSDVRRGGPAIHLLHGVDMAINTGNFLYFEPTYLIENASLGVSLKYKVLTLYLRVMRTLHFGQGLDILWHNDHTFLPSREEYLQMCRFKTGALSRLAAEIGAASAGADDGLISTLGRLWEDIGVGFQILDDVKNLVTGNPGKTRGDDIVEGKKSLPVLCHAEASSDKGKGLLALLAQVRSARASGAPLAGLIENCIDLMEASGGIAHASELGNQLLSGAQERLEEDLPDGSARREMEGLISTFWEGLKK